MTFGSRFMPWMTPCLCIALIVGYWVHGSNPLLFMNCGELFAGEWWRLFGHALTHRDEVHLLSNVLAISILSLEIERRHSWKLILMVVACGLLSAALADCVAHEESLGIRGSSAIGWALWGSWLTLQVRRASVLLLFILASVSYVYITLARSPAIAVHAHVIAWLAGLCVGFLWRRRQVIF